MKIRGNPSHIAEKYIQLARDAQTSGDPIAAENYYQHAEHYYRLIAAAQEQFRQNNPHFPVPRTRRPQARATMPTRMATTTSSRRWAARRNRPSARASRSPICRATRSRSRSTTSSTSRNSTTSQRQQQQPRSYQGKAPADGDVDRLPSFITGGQPPQHQGHQPNPRARTATTIRPTAFRCIAAGAAIAARARTYRAVKAETAPPRAIETSQ